MKREYSTPVMKVEVFEASESVAACYKINCNVPGSGILWAETNGEKGLQTSGSNKDTQLTFKYYGACNRWHKGVIQGKDPEFNGYWRDIYGNTTKVYWWKEDLGSASDYHATRMDGIREWETNTNAS